MLAAFLLGSLFGFLGLVAVEALAIVWVIDRLRRKKAANEVSERGEGRDLDGERPVTFPYSKQGVVWVLEPDSVPKISSDVSATGGSKERRKKKEIMDAFPVKKYAKLKDHSLILTDLDGSQATIELTGCTVASVSASNLSSRKWAKRYPIRLESKDSVVYDRSKTCYLYIDTSWEKESWCKALRLASCIDRVKLHWYAQLSEEFHNYLALLNAEYPCFLKPAMFFGEAMDKTNRVDGSSRVRLFLKKLAKKASTKTGLESKTSLGSSLQAERKMGEKLHSYSGLSQEEKSSSNSLPDLVQPSSPSSFTLSDKGQPSMFPDAVCDEKSVQDEGSLCLNLLVSRLFFDVKRNSEIRNSIKARIQRSLSNMRTPTYIGEITCTQLDLGNLPPYIHKMRLLPMNLNELWAVEVDFEYSDGVVLDIETRLEVHEPELQNDIMNTSFGTDSIANVNSDLLEGIEHYGNQLKSSSNSTVQIENKGEEEEVDDLRRTKSSSWTSTYMSRWKAILHSIADQVSQVPFCLALKVTAVRGTLRLHIKPPPSDQLWFGFPSMPEIVWNLESSVGDRKITNTHIASLIGSRFKAAIRETLVLPNCESVCIPWMLADKGDWISREGAPFIWGNQETVDARGSVISSSQPEEPKSKLDSSNRRNGPSAYIDTKEEVHVEHPPKEPPSESSSSHGSSVSSRQPSYSSTNEELKIPLLSTESSRESSIQSRQEPPMASSSRGIVTVEELNVIHHEDDTKPKKNGRRARMMDFGKRMGDKLEEKRRHIEEKSKHIVEKMLDNTRT
ncbi:uncharacterized protein [Typha latifolia]|uniref:uncharacterized protein n=1 Tax=Typha latifolia TaxID=4733 RepID=UPI003C2B1BDF